MSLLFRPGIWRRHRSVIVRAPIDGYLDTKGSLLQAKAVLRKAA